MVTMVDIAKKAGVSQATVSRVLNGKGSTARISASTQKRVQAIARRLQFHPSFAGQALVRGRTRSIGFMCGNIRNPHYTDMADAAMEAVEQRGYHLVMAVTRWFSWENDLECFDGLLARGVDGVIYFGNALAPATPQYERVVRERFPLVSISYQVPGLPCILSDNQPGMDEAFALLKANGHTRIIGIRSEAPEKRIPFLTAAAKYGFEVEEGPPLASDGPRRDEQTLLEVRQEAHRFAERKDRPTAVFVSSDFLAAAFICGLWEKGVMIPRDVSVFSYDGTQAGEVMAPPLTSVTQDAPEIIRRALKIIFDRIERDETPNPAPVEMVPTRLVIRQSIGPNIKI